MDERFKEVAHTADIAIRVWGHNLAELFSNAAYGMACQVTEADEISLTIERSIELEAHDTEILLVNWLNELLYLGERENSAFTDFDMHEVTPTRLRAMARGGPIEKHCGHIKAVTFSELDITQSDEGYETTIVFDV